MKTKKILFVVIFGTILALAQNTNAMEEARLNGNPMNNENHFVWDLMADMQTPDDADCPTLAQALLESEDFSAEEAATIAGIACTNLAQIRTNMQSDMPEGGEESVETNLWDAANWHTVENLYFAHSTNGVPDGRISFSVPIDFMSFDFMNFMTSFGENMETSEGYISLDADTVGGFANYGASLTMYNIPKFDNPKILVNGQEDNQGVVSNLVYDQENNTLTFSAAHFSSFEVVESDEKPDIDSVKYKKFYNPLTGDWRVKVLIKGDNFKKSTQVTLGSRKPYKTTYRNNDEMVAYFSLNKFLRSGKSNLVLKAANGNESKKFHKKLKISTLTSDYTKID